MFPKLISDDLFPFGGEESLIHPTIAAIPDGHLLIADWTGRLCIVARNGSLKTQTWLPPNSITKVSDAIYGMAIDPVLGRYCLLATRHPDFYLWDSHTSHFTQIYSNSRRQVCCVSFSPNGQNFAIGCGDYPLDSDRISEAYLELWSLNKSEPIFERCVALPGVCADSLTWSEDGNEVYCTTGLRNQKDGFLMVLGSDAVPRRAWEIGTALTRWCTLRPLHAPNSVVTSNSRGLSCLSTNSGQSLWHVALDTSSSVYDAVLDVIVLDNGPILNANDGAVALQINPLKGCSALTVIPWGAYAAVSTNGTLRCWSPALTESTPKSE